MTQDVNNLNKIVHGFSYDFPMSVLWFFLCIEHQASCSMHPTANHNGHLMYYYQWVSRQKGSMVGNTAKQLGVRFGIVVFCSNIHWVCISSKWRIKAWGWIPILFSPFWELSKLWPNVGPWTPCLWQKDCVKNARKKQMLNNKMFASMGNYKEKWDVRNMCVAGRV